MTKESFTNIQLRIFRSHTTSFPLHTPTSDHLFHLYTECFQEKRKKCKYFDWITSDNYFHFYLTHSVFSIFFFHFFSSDYIDDKFYLQKIFILISLWGDLGLLRFVLRLNGLSQWDSDIMWGFITMWI